MRPGQKLLDLPSAEANLATARARRDSAQWEASAPKATVEARRDFEKATAAFNVAHNEFLDAKHAHKIRTGNECATAEAEAAAQAEAARVAALPPLKRTPGTFRPLKSKPARCRRTRTDPRENCDSAPCATTWPRWSCSSPSCRSSRRSIRVAARTPGMDGYILRAAGPSRVSQSSDTRP